MNNPIWRTCAKCGREYNPADKTHGLITLCNQCAPLETTPRVGGNMIWDSKHAPELVIRQDIVQARRYARPSAKLYLKPKAKGPTGLKIAKKWTGKAGRD